MAKILALLVAAHAVGDFLLQPDTLARRKATGFGAMILHAVIVAATSYLFLQAWTCWQVPAYVLVVHTVIDVAKRNGASRAVWAFVLDQATHVASLWLLAELALGLGWLTGFQGDIYRVLIVIGGLAATVPGAGLLIGLCAERLMADNRQVLADLQGLKGGGKYIGQLERALIFILIFVQQPAAIGFLVAAKSILRFEGVRNQHLAEYVLIGTLLSFSLAIVLTRLTQWALTF